MGSETPDTRQTRSKPQAQGRQPRQVNCFHAAFLQVRGVMSGENTVIGDEGNAVAQFAETLEQVNQPQAARILVGLGRVGVDDQHLAFQAEITRTADFTAVAMIDDRR